MQVLIESNKKHESVRLIPYILLGGMVTVMNAEGKPVQVPAGALQAANVQNHIGKIYDLKTIELCARLMIDQIRAFMIIFPIIIDQVIW